MPPFADLPVGVAELLGQGLVRVTPSRRPLEIAELDCVGDVGHRERLVAVAGATKVDITSSVTARDGRSLMDQKITGRVRFFGENLGVTNDLAKRITKLVRETF